MKKALAVREFQEAQPRAFFQSLRPFAPETALSGMVLEERGDKIVAELGISGIRPEDIEISVQGEFLKISGERKEDCEVKKGHCYMRESSYGAFKRVAGLPAGVSAEEAKATYKKGLLRIELKKSPTRKMKDFNIALGLKKK